MKDISIIIPAAGQGKRLGARTGKPFIRLKDKPILLHIIDIFSHIPGVREIIIAINPRNTRRVKQLLPLPSPTRGEGKGGITIKLAKGGRRRQDSVYNALKVVDPQSRYVLVHDAVRPLITRNLIITLIKETKKTGAALLAIPIIDTIKMVNLKTRRVKKTLTPRSELYLTQTPQGFKKEILVKAYEKGRHKRETTDDGSLVESLGYPVKVVPGSYTNLKITTPIDLAVARQAVARY